MPKRSRRARKKRKSSKRKGKKRKSSSKKSSKSSSHHHSSSGNHFDSGQNVYSSDLPTCRNEDDTVYGTVKKVSTNRIWVDFGSKHGGTVTLIKMDHEIDQFGSSRWIGSFHNGVRIISLQKKLSKAEQDEKDYQEAVVEDRKESKEKADESAKQIAQWFELVEREFNKMEAVPKHKPLLAKGGHNVDGKHQYPVFVPPSKGATSGAPTVRDNMGGPPSDSQAPLNLNDKFDSESGIEMNEDQKEGQSAAYETIEKVAGTIKNNGGQSEKEVEQVLAALDLTLDYAEKFAAHIKHKNNKDKAKGVKDAIASAKKIKGLAEKQEKKESNKKGRKKKSNK